MVTMFVVTNYVIRIHRHYTFGLVYGDATEFARRRGLYIWFPVLLFAFMLPFALAGFYPGAWNHGMYVALVAITVPGGVWNVFHIIMQKYGVLRAYGVKLGYGDPGLERRLLLSWSVCLAAAVLAKYSPVLVSQVRVWQRVDIRFVEPLLPLVRGIVIAAFACAAYLTARWLRQEVAHYSRVNIPKLLYAASIPLLLSTFFYSLVVGYMAFGFSHAIEYIIFVNIYGARRKTAAAWVRNPWIMNSVWIVGVLTLYAILKYLPAYREASLALTLGYTTYNSYMHFLYDGFIWKMRNSNVRAAVLEVGT